MSNRPAAPLTPEQKAALMRRLSRCASPVARLVARRLLDLDHGHGAFPGYQVLADYVGAAPGTVRNALSDLERLGALVSHREPGLGNLRAYFIISVESWQPRVTRNPDTDALSPKTVTTPEPSPTVALSVSLSASSSASPPVSPDAVQSIQQVGSSEQENSRTGVRSAVALGEALAAGGNNALTLPGGRYAEREAEIVTLERQAAAATNHHERRLLLATAHIRRKALANGSTAAAP